MAAEKKKKKKKQKIVPPGILVDIAEIPGAVEELGLEESYQEMLDHLSTANPSMGNGKELRVMTQEAYSAIEARLIALLGG